MFRSYDHLHAEIFTLEISLTDNGSVVFRILVNLVHNSNSFLVTVNVVTAGKFPMYIFPSDDGRTIETCTG
jgi:hypothetical protein